MTAQLEQEMRIALPGVTFNFSQYIQDNIEEAISGVKGANSVKIIGPALAVLEDLARQVMEQMSKVQGVQDLGVFHVLGQPNLNIKIDRAKTARYGLNTGDVNTVVQATMGGAVASQVLEGDRFFNLTVRLAPQYRSSIEAIGNVKVGYQTNSGANAYIPLRELASISLDSGPAYIYHEAMNRDIPVKFSVRGRDLGSTVAEVQERIARSVKFPRGYRLEWAGEFQDLQLAKQRLAVFVPMSLALILILLYSLFNSLRDSLLALAGIPFCDQRRCIGAVCRPIAFQRLGGHRIHIAVRRLGNERHPRHYLFQSTETTGDDSHRGHGAGRRKTHATDADDGAVRLHRSGAGGVFYRYRQSGATSTGNGGRRRHAHRTHSAARGRTGVAAGVPAQGGARQAETPAAHRSSAR